jgi:hypothetical protein
VDAVCGCWPPVVRSVHRCRSVSAASFKSSFNFRNSVYRMWETMSLSLFVDFGQHGVKWANPIGINLKYNKLAVFRSKNPYNCWRKKSLVFHIVYI